MKKVFIYLSEASAVSSIFLSWNFVNGLLQFLILLPAVIVAWLGLWQMWKNRKTKNQLKNE